MTTRDLLVKYGALLKTEIQDNLAKATNFAPGFNGSAYSNGRNNMYGGAASKSPYGSNLYNSVTIKITDDETLELSMADYWKYVEYGVPAKPQYLKGKGSGTSTLIPILMDWAESKGLPRGAAFAIRRNIWKYGIVPTPFYGIAIDKVTEMIASEFDKDADKMIDEFLDRLFD